MIILSRGSRTPDVPAPSSAVASGTRFTWPSHQHAGTAVSACRAFQPDHGELHQSQIAELANELVNGRQLSQDAIRIQLGRVFGWTQSPPSDSNTSPCYLSEHRRAVASGSIS